MVDEKKPSAPQAPPEPPEDKAPKRPRQSSKNTKTKWPAAAAVEAALNSYVSGAGMIITMVNPVDGEIIAENSAGVIKELIELGRVDRKLRKVLERLATPGKYGPLMVACSPIVIGIAANHNLLPQFIFKTQTPESEEE
ncbi:MAG: hypothetical protein ACYCZF_13860 [Anaerolineae bacterium]